MAINIAVTMEAAGTAVAGVEGAGVAGITELSFLAELYRKEAPLFSYRDAEFIQILHNVEMSCISAQIYTQLKRRNHLDAVPRFFKDRLKQGMEQALFQNLLIKNETDQILDCFEHSGIDVIPLKGVYFAKQYFGHLGARITSDIDLLIRAADYREAVHRIQQLGFLQQNQLKSAHYHAVFYKTLQGQQEPLAVELHWEIERPGTSNLMASTLWEAIRNTNVEGHVRYLPFFDTFYLICLHGIRHRMDSLKYVVDIAHLLYWYQDELDFDKLLDRARQDQTVTRICAALSIVDQIVPQRIPLDPFRSRAWWRLWTPKGLHPLFVLDRWKHCFGLLWQLIFPPHSMAVRSSGGGKKDSLIKYYINQYSRRWNKYFG